MLGYTNASTAAGSRLANSLKAFGTDRLYRESVRRRAGVRGPQIWELSEQITVGSYAVRRHLSICEDGEEVIEHVVRERPAMTPRA